MDAVIMLALRIGLLALLWIFILVALNAMRRDTNKSAGAIRQQSKKVGAPRRREAIKQLSIVEGPCRDPIWNWAHWRTARWAAPLTATLSRAMIILLATMPGYSAAVANG